MGHATGLGRRLLDSLGLMEVEPLMAQGTPKDIAYEPSRREKDETSRYRTEAMGILARKEPDGAAAVYLGLLKLKLDVEATRRCRRGLSRLGVEVKETK